MGDMTYVAERAAFDQHDYAPAASVLVSAYKRGALNAEDQALETELLSRLRADWRELYVTGKAAADNVNGGGKGRQTADFFRSYLTSLFPPGLRQWAGVGFTDAEVEGLVSRLDDDVRRALGAGRKLNAAKLHQVQLEGQRRALAELVASRMSEDTQDRAARVFFRAKDLPQLSAIYAGRLGAPRPLLSALEVSDWEEILRLWVRGWRPASEAVRIRVAARIDGAPVGGAIDLITTY